MDPFTTVNLPFYSMGERENNKPLHKKFIQDMCIRDSI